MTQPGFPHKYSYTQKEIVFNKTFLQNHCLSIIYRLNPFFHHFYMQPTYSTVRRTQNRGTKTDIHNNKNNNNLENKNKE